MSARARVELLAVPGLPEVRPGDDLAALLLRAIDHAGLDLRDGDVVAVSSKVVAKAEGRYAADREAAVGAETVRVVAERRTGHGTARIVRSRSGPVLAAAGVDASNLADGEAALMLPLAPDASAGRLRATLAERARVGVIVTDTLGRPWRIGQTDAAVGAAGVAVGEDLSGLPDTGGRPMEVTHRALADEIAAAADLVKGKVDGVPVALVRGLSHLVLADGDDGAGAAALLRTPAEDWFRYGHAEAARAALGVLAGQAGVPVQPVSGGGVRQRLERALAVALAAPPLTAVGLPVLAHLVDETVTIPLPVDAPAPQAWAEAGALAQRIVVAAWAEDLPVAVRTSPENAALVIRGLSSPG